MVNSGEPTSLRQKHIVMLGESGFPRGLATIQRTILMSKAFLAGGAAVTVICRKGTQPRHEEIHFPKEGKFEGIDYKYTANSIYRPDGFLKRNLHKIKGIFGEFNYLRNLKNTKGIDLAVVSELKVVHITRFLLYAKILNFPIALNFMEMTSSMQHRGSLIKRINDYVLDKWLIRIFDAALPISDRLMEYYETVAPTKPRLKLPILCDYDKFDRPRLDDSPYFLYCGSFRYKEVRDFIIEAFERLSENKHMNLYMIVSGGSKAETAALQEELNSRFTDPAIKLFSNIPYEQLVQLYVDAKAMLIPLRDTEQDRARFPHKIGEYLASGNPVITTNVGEILTYFSDGENALVAQGYTRDTFAEKMKIVLEHPSEASKIGMKGKETGLREFDYKVHGARLMDFVAQVAENSGKSPKPKNTGTT